MKLQCDKSFKRKLNHSRWRRAEFEDGKFKCQSGFISFETKDFGTTGVHLLRTLFAEIEKGFGSTLFFEIRTEGGHGPQRERDDVTARQVRPGAVHDGAAQALIELEGHLEPRESEVDASVLQHLEEDDGNPQPPDLDARGRPQHVGKLVERDHTTRLFEGDPQHPVDLVGVAF